MAWKNELLGDQSGRILILCFSSAIALSIFGYTLIYPQWLSSKRKGEVERNLLFAARHMMIQTSAGVPLFDVMASLSEEYDDKRLNYGQIGKEFKKIVKEVRGGRDLNSALEEAASLSPSPYFKRMLWQIANANKAGANMGVVLRDVVEFLSNEQRILIRDYGSQLNPLSMFYMLSCIIAPTMGIIFLAIFSSVATLPVNELTFIAILCIMVVVQIVFIGMIKSRRPAVAM
ncbi:MAG: type II secretion system F family protein [Candidatus Micrarchaeota archaeon]|nr:type II secretion system F family protein [Candidatus Micrarchaeota archaeon]